jgi:hypothetical protein
VMRRRNCTSTGHSTGHRSSDGCVNSKLGSRRPNPLLNGTKAATPCSKRRSPRIGSPEEDGGTGGASCNGSGVRGNESAHSTPVRGSGVHTKHRRTSSPSPAL